MRLICFAAAAIGLALAAPVPAFAATDAAAPQDFRAWLDQAVDRNLTFPAALERSNASGIAMVRFSVAPDGRPADVEILRSSGDGTIDRAALRTIATLDLPQGAPAGPHVALLQYGTAANAADAAAYSAQLQAARQEAQLALRASEGRRLARAGGAPASVSTLD